ncbi:MAG: tRNA threonylcarbamoyladenosine dehydratase [Bacteroidales bacterium]|nr:tRNA threonylcarbamoyladenosine dehydratase [Bacteroidales bacterium]
MSTDLYARTRLLLQDEGISLLRHAHVLVVGLGGVGGYAAEQLCRAGVGRLTLVDGDVVAPTNLNRQLIALRSTVGQPKAQLFQQRFYDINPDCQVVALQEYLRDERTVELLQSDHYDCVVDCIDTLSPKVFLLYHAHRLSIPTVSSMGSGGKLDPSQVHAADISKSHTCPLAAMVRKRLHHMGVYTGIRVVFSTEKVPPHAMVEDPSDNHLTTIGTISYMPPLFGCMIAAEVVFLLTQKHQPNPSNPQ